METKSKWIAAVQMTSGNDKTKNIEICNSLIEQAVTHKQAKMVFLPEGFDFIANGIDETVQLAEPMDGSVVENYKNIAKKHKIWLSLGGFHHKSNESMESPKITITHIIIDDTGEIIAVYNKAHLFDVYLPERNIELCESKTIKAGEELGVPVQTVVGKVGLAISYDLRFPEFSETLRKLGAELLIYPSAFTTFTNVSHCEILLRARAIENQCYVVAAVLADPTQNMNDSSKLCCQSMIINPRGEVIAQACSSEKIIFAKIDLKELENIRKETSVINQTLVQSPHSSIMQRQKYVIPDNYLHEDSFDFGDIKINLKYCFLESKLSRAFLGRKANLPGQVMVISKRPVARIISLTDEEISDLYLLVNHVVAIMESVQGSISANVACQDGVHAGQSIKHVHIHVLPRREGDFVKQNEPEELKWRTDTARFQECEHIRNTIRAKFDFLLE